MEDVIEGLGRLLGILEFGLDENGACALSFDGAGTIEMEYAEDTGLLHLHAALVPLPVDNRADFYASLLSSHLFGIDTAGAFFAVDDVAGEIILFRSCEAKALSPEALFETLEIFVRAVETWQDKLRSAISIPGDGDIEDSPPRDPNAMIRI